MKKSDTAPWQSLPRGIHRLRIGTKRLGFYATVWVGRPGPTLLANGSTHGDEYEGPTFLTGLADTLKPGSLVGTVVAVPVLNEAAFFAGTRNHPEDDGNLARVFPGDASGSASEKLADLFLKKAIRFADYYLDFHSAGVSYEILPWVGFITLDDAANNEIQKKMAACFGNLWCWESPYLPGRTISAAAELNIPHLYTESVGAGGVTTQDLQDLDSGFFAVLRLLGFLKGKHQPAKNWKYRATTDVDEAHLQLHHPSPFQGIFVQKKTVGEKVRKNQILGFIHRLDGSQREPVKASSTGLIVMIRRKRSVERGEALATIVP